MKHGTSHSVTRNTEQIREDRPSGNSSRDFPGSKDGLSTWDDEESAKNQLLELHSFLEPEIEKRLFQFKEVWRQGSDEELFRELAFCLLTPQSRARICWAAIEGLSCQNLITDAGPTQIQGHLRGVRFKYRKAEYICLARSLFTAPGQPSLRQVLQCFSSPEEARQWLVSHVLGMGFKEASHFLRNIGLGEDLAILDRHILKNLVRFGVIKEIPKSLTPKRYLEIEDRMRAFSLKMGIPMGNLDLVLWFMEAGEIFK